MLLMPHTPSSSGKVIMYMQYREAKFRNNMQ